MKQKSIDFRELLERVLPLDLLPPADRLRVERALKSGITSQLEQAAMFALEQLERHGAIQRLSGQAGNGGPQTLRFQPRDGIDVITVQLPAPAHRDGVFAYPRQSLPGHAQAGLDQVRRLLRLDDPLLISDPRRTDARLGLFEQLNQAGRELLGAVELRFLPVTGTEGPSGERSVAPGVVEEVRSHPDTIYYCPDTEQSPRGAAEAERRRATAWVMAGVATDGAALGHLEVLHASRNPFRPEDLAMVALLADCCASGLERLARLEKLVFIDPLTAAYNRSYFDLQLQNEMARAQREKSSMALCIADIDDFKSFNTKFGYEAGNQVLIQVAQALKGGVRPFDTVARWGGEEFAVLLTAPVHAEDVVTVSERLRQLVERQTVRVESLERKSHRVGVTVSIGVALYPDHEETAEDLWRAANQALLSAKRPPKNQVVFYKPPGDSRLNPR